MEEWFQVSYVVDDNSHLRYHAKYFKTARKEIKNHILDATSKLGFHFLFMTFYPCRRICFQHTQVVSASSGVSCSFSKARLEFIEVKWLTVTIRETRLRKTSVNVLQEGFPQRFQHEIPFQWILKV